MYWQIWPWCFEIYRPSKIFTGPGLLAVVFHKPWLKSITRQIIEHYNEMEDVQMTKIVHYITYEDDIHNRGLFSKGLLQNVCVVPLNYELKLALMSV